MSNYIYASIDTETTGLDPVNHEIIELSIIIYNPETYTEITRFLCNIRPMHPERIREEALKVSDKTLEEVLKYPTPLQIKSSLHQWKTEAFGNAKIFPLGHNFCFDKSFLVRFLKPDLYDELFYYKYKDTFVLAQALKDANRIPEDLSLSLTNLCKFYDIKFQPHQAYEDAKATLKVYSKMIDLIR